jgi:hypothetical protein
MILNNMFYNLFCVRLVYLAVELIEMLKPAVCRVRIIFNIVLELILNIQNTPGKYHYSNKIKQVSNDRIFPCSYREGRQMSNQSSVKKTDCLKDVDCVGTAKCCNSCCAEPSKFSTHASTLNSATTVLILQSHISKLNRPFSIYYNSNFNPRLGC